MNNPRIREWIASANADSRIPEIIFGLLIFGLGIAVRLNFVSGSEYPLNDGGFFYSMTGELIKNKFLLPEFSMYNHANIPFAYPPLAFYLIGFIHKIIGISLFDLFKYFPLIISSLTIPIFYLLSGRFFEKKIYRLIAAYIFVTLPRSFEWFVMGGGATRSLGFFFAMLSIYFLWEAFEDKKFNSKWILGTLFSALTILSHPLSSVFLAFSVIVLFVYHFPVKLKFVVAYGCMIMILTSPWWVTVLINHGLSPFIGASGTGHLDWFEIKNLVTQNYGYENPFFLQITSMLAILGLFSKRKKISLTLGILCVVGYFVIPRGGADYLTAYLPILATIGFQVITDPWNNEKSILDDNNQFPVELRSKKTRALLAFIFIYLFLGSYTYKYVYNKVSLRLDENNVQAMEWLKENTNENNTVLTIPINEENRYWWNDFISEWLPVLSERENLITVQGYEWKPDIFEDRIEKYWILRNCSNDSDCIVDWQESNDFYPEFIYFDNLIESRRLAKDFLESGNYLVVFENDTVMIIENTHE